MRDIWFFSDHHFSHRSILKFTDSKSGELIRPMFRDVDHMDEYMIDTWNETIKPGDLVWHGGDITFDRKKFTDSILNKLHGKLRIVLGNHDDAKFLASLGRIEKIVATRRFDEFGFIVSHYPLHESSLWNHRQQKNVVNLHGHIHQNPSPDGLYINMSVEETNYKPIHIEDMVLKAKALYDLMQLSWDTSAKNRIEK